MLTQLFAQILLFFYHTLGGNLGLAIIVLTLVIKSVLFPISLNSLKAAEKMKLIQPDLEKIKKKHKKNPKKLQQAQIELFKKHKVNPLASFLPQVVQIVIFILLYRLLVGFLGTTTVDGEVISAQFLWLDLTKPDPMFILPILAAVSQFFLSYLMQKGQSRPKLAKSNKKENNGDFDGVNMMAGMGKTMLYFMPIITGLFALKLPSGLVIYWVTSTIFSLVQQLYLIKTTALD